MTTVGPGPRTVPGLMYLLVIVVLSVLLETSAQTAENLPFSCNFDGNNVCNFQQVTQDQFDWSLGYLLTPSGQAHQNDSQMTGPRGGQAGTYHYIFLEASSPRQTNDVARLRTPPLLWQGDICVRFYYHMLGAAVGSLGVDIIPPSTSTNPVRSVWSNNVNMGDRWIPIERTVTNFEWLSQIEFWGSIGGAQNPGLIWSGDLAFDTITISSGQCAAPTAAPPPAQQPPGVSEGPDTGPTGIPPQTPPPGTSEVVLPYVCDFESDFCGMSTLNVPGVLDWTRLQDSTPTLNTGPTRAFRGRWYIYVETSEPRQPGDTYILVTPMIRYQGSACLSFAYHMFGPDVGQLRIYSSPSNRNIFNLVSDQGNAWRETSVDIQLDFLDRIYFEATRGNYIRGDIALDLVRIDANPCNNVATPQPTPSPTQAPTPGPPTGIRRLPWNCTFENDLCGMQQSSNDRFDWERKSRNTPTIGTGPGQARSGAYYIFIESSDPRIPDDKAIISTPMLDARGDVCVQFYYNMYGSGMGTLKAYVTRYGPSFQFFERSGNQGNAWRFERVTANFFNNGDQISFEAIRGPSYTSDIALDDIAVYQGACPGTTPTQVPPTRAPPTPGPPTFVPPVGERFSCNVEDNQGNDISCRLRQDFQDQLDWNRYSGKTPSGALYSRRTPSGLYPVTGPDGARQGQYYLYIEASGRPRGLVARVFIEGSDVTRGGDACLRFYYSMNGFHMGELRVMMRAGGAARAVNWWVAGDRGPGWHNAAVDINLNGLTELALEATTAGEFSGDVSLDDIRVQPGLCEAPPPQFIFLCNFETSSGAATMCGMQQVSTDNFDWTLQDGPTPSQVTGPDRAYSGQYYMFIEASRPRVRGDFAILLTPGLRWNGDACLEFAYSMYGFHIGSLEVFTQDAFSAPSVLWSESGQKGNRWLQARVTLQNFRADSQIGFRGVRGGEYSGDIAIDSIVVRPNRC